MSFKVYGYITVTTVLFQVIYNAQSTAFIDEIFHIPQAKKYCSGQFNEWDPKITTLPAMYILSMLVLTPLTGIKGSSACTVWALRYMNVLYNAGTVVLAYYIIKKLNENVKSSNAGTEDEESNKKHHFTSLTVGFFPLLYFLSFLYYTEPGSTLLVLAAYLACLHGNHKLAAGLGFLAILFRQNNIVWVVFMGGAVAADHLETIKDIERISTSPELKDKLARFLAKLAAALLKYLLVIDHLRAVAILIWPYLSVICVFCLFAYLNNGIVVGDRSSHVAIFHPAQLLYFLGFSLFFGSPVLISLDKFKRFVHTFRKYPIHFGASAMLCLYVLLAYTHIHPYLLADNRHYAFYVWKYFLGRRFLRFCFIPIYIYAAWSMNDSLKLSERCTVLWKIVFVVCVSAVLVPQKLLEFRYFILPYLLFRLHIKNQSVMVLILEVTLQVVLNIATISIFLNKTFSWSDLDEPQRIMW
ncbi:dol-P-Glc:Glc(2)Man(9)GlcNAc(2)-PP-Dol alpha-1,2-glucosyltransferase-like [Clavelina lepadiformis]|uniref:Dol-P-Glc:Glc(2)Man(9)GlcNAc(2)-PP-Dol alpha-1,2-glucosyltransferase n=1 Tax=Clavelina lepadiformis TaxID=159417 RepID=A0ABP0FC36_CLALP